MARGWSKYSELVTSIFIILSYVRIQDPNAGEIVAKEKVTVITMKSAKTVCGANSIIGGEMITAGQVKWKIQIDDDLKCFEFTLLMIYPAFL